MDLVSPTNPIFGTAGIPILNGPPPAESLTLAAEDGLRLTFGDCPLRVGFA
ncbi:hypothetical protein [Actinoplanes aureus]|uniref:Uncharacterized protein n=1 Tax=Actinoplanes aureus TaxID=2792083 RepID=A0A931CL42_9ACTN|nr:hypothetical protein [Actinoplanes aureus]MBG0568406.1 hypothetical protein [Actinoplanes aureus]